ncbi:hypothetical protein D3C73_1396960 [compost metagenome]
MVSASLNCFSTAGGVPFGASSPVNVAASMPCTPASANVGTSGIDGTRLAVVTANARKRPSFTYGSATEI